jgi:hypothetical protein
MLQATIHSALYSDTATDYLPCSTLSTDNATDYRLYSTLLCLLILQATIHFALVWLLIIQATIRSALYSDTAIVYPLCSVYRYGKNTRTATFVYRT